MKEYMVISVVDGEQHAEFFDSSTKADNYRMDIEVSLNGYAQLYRLLQVRDLSTGTPMCKEYQFVTD